MRSGFSFLLVLTLVSSTLLAQDLSDLFELHKENMTDLYAARGAPSAWMTSGEVSEDEIFRTLNSYYDNAGLLFYIHQHDTLSVIFFNGNGVSKLYQLPTPIIELEEKVSSAASLYASNSFHRAPQLRGAAVEGVSEQIALESFQNLNEKLLPFKKDLAELRHLVIVPTANISMLPFAAFRLDDSTYLIDKMSVSVAPSLFEFMVSSQMNKDERYAMRSYGAKQGKDQHNRALFVGNPTFTENSHWIFPQLPGTSRELDSLTITLDSNFYDILEKREANPTNVMENISEYSLLYFATHGLSNPTSPMDSSFLVLAEDSTGKFLLSAREIMNTRHTQMMEAKLVVLSACQTGLGRSLDGGVIGLTRAFQVAGANHVLMSLWNVSDDETAKLMTFFFKELQGYGIEFMPHDALRKAILKYRREVSDDPNYWAAFTLFGVPY